MNEPGEAQLNMIFRGFVWYDGAAQNVPAALSSEEMIPSSDCECIMQTLLCDEGLQKHWVYYVTSVLHQSRYSKETDQQTQSSLRN